MSVDERWFRNIRIVHPSIDDRVDGLAGHLALAFGAIVGWLVLQIALSTAYAALFRGGSPVRSVGVAFLMTGATLFVVMAFLWWWLDAQERRTAFPFRSPSTTEIGWALAFVPLGFATVQLVTAAMAPLGYEFTGPNYDLTDPVIAAGVLVGPLLLAPIFEEALFRGLLLGSLLDRGLSPTAAALVTIPIFAVPHIWLGVAGVVGLAAWAIFPTILRLRFNNLTGAALLHFLNNVIAYVVLVAFSF